jgi:hypothetical protein
MNALGLDPYFRRIFEEIAACRKASLNKDDTCDGSACPQSEKVGAEPNRNGGQSKCNDRSGLSVAVPGVSTVPTKIKKESELIASGGFPIEWYAISCELSETDEPLECFGDRWKTMAEDAGVFLERWGKTAYLLGWTVLDLFGVHPTAPAARFDVMGLIPILNGRRVVAITRDTATIRAPSGAILTYRRNPQAVATAVTRCACNEARGRGSY